MGSRLHSLRLSAAAASALCALAVLPGAASASSACPGDEEVPTMATAPQASQALVCDMNALRARNGLGPVHWDWKLWTVAQRMANDMAKAHYFSHVDSLGRHLYERVEPAHYLRENPGELVVENLGWANGVLSSPLALSLGWMNSAGHRENILDRQVRDIGVGMAEGPAQPDGTSGMFYVVEFGSQGDAPRPTASRARRASCARAKGPRRTRCRRARTRHARNL